VSGPQPAIERWPVGTRFAWRLPRSEDIKLGTVVGASRNVDKLRVTLDSAPAEVQEMYCWELERAT